MADDVSMQRLQGLGVAEGIAIGRAVCLETRLREVFRFPLEPEAVGPEIERLHKAVDEATRAAHELSAKVGEEIGNDLAGIFEAHALILRDRQLLDRIERRIRGEQVNAEWAVWETTEALKEQFEQLEDERFRDRAQDLVEVGRQLLNSLQGVSHHDLSEYSGNIVVIADDLTPGDAVRFGRQGVVGFALEAGGRTSHTAIIAHSLDIPLVTGLPGITRLAAQEDPVIVDGGRGEIVLHPSSALISSYEALAREQRARMVELESTRELRAETRDGEVVRLMANIDLVEEVAEASRFGAEGVGLYRSEFLYIERSPELPTEEEHFLTYREIAAAMRPHPVVIRTFDLGGRKLARELLATHEDNPVLGLRGIRLTLAMRDVFRPQLRGLFRAARHGDLRIMLPLVSSIEEVRRFKAFASEVMEELAEENVPFEPDVELGVMIEVPAAAMIADQLAKEVSFFSIGTNDLIQYSMAVDRNNEHVAELYQPLHPGLLRMIGSVCDAARAADITVSVCGEMAADPRGAAVLVGLGVRRLSLSPKRVPVIKTAIRGFECERLRSVLRDCRNLATAGEVEQALDSALGLSGWSAEVSAEPGAPVHEH